MMRLIKGEPYGASKRDACHKRDYYRLEKIKGEPVS